MSRQTYRILFEGVRGPNFNGDIALDDVAVTSGICTQQGVSTTTVAPTPFTTASMYRKVPKFPEARNFAVIHVNLKKRGQT